LAPIVWDPLMTTRNRSWLQIALALFLGFFVAGTRAWLPLRAAQAPKNEAAKQPSTDIAEQSALDNAFRSAEGNPQILIKNLEAFLARFPHSPRRQIILRTICINAIQANAPGIVVQYGQILLGMAPDDPQILSVLLEALSRQNDQASRKLAIDYASRLIKITESQRDRAAAPGNNNAPEQWAERSANIYAQRAGFYRDSGDTDKALADDEKSYATYPTGRVAEQLGDLELKKGNTARALDDYLTAFAFPEKNPDFARVQAVRRKLASLYVAKHHSEKGLGDRILSRYDALSSQLGGRFAGDQHRNSGVRDPFEFVLERLDGSPLRMADYRGKVVVLDFWATWCGPCRLQGKIVDQVAQHFRGNSDAAFLSVNMDQDRSGVPAFLKQEGWTLPAAYAQGLDELLSVRSLPTLVVFDRQGRVAYRNEGVIPEPFAQELDKHLRQTLQTSEGSKP
jgi:thiol-disulfide isomerase/thioredoxin